jgi:flagellar biosynthesis/type III secretory pathway protein FliH
LLAPERFRSLASMIRAAQPQDRAEEPAQAEYPDAAEPEGVALAEVGGMLRDVRLFRARVSELVDDTVEKLCCDVAAQVLARELHLAPSDVRKIVDAALRRYFGEEPLRIRAHPREAQSLECDIPVVADESLRSGDIIIELRNGTIDATLGVRLDAVLRSLS